ncbi:hypothetical protein ACU635_41285 [[Actinomadura] parvosata]|uniref:hypothetical protein n=1 Tax=[Actinomadura] parvosata TaxID=1955412 RepID=UPI00406CBB92
MRRQPHTSLTRTRHLSRLRTDRRRAARRGGGRQAAGRPGRGHGPTRRSKAGGAQHPWAGAAPVGGAAGEGGTSERGGWRAEAAPSRRATHPTAAPAAGAQAV